MRTEKLKTNMKDNDFEDKRNITLEFKESQLWNMMIALENVTNKYRIECGLLSREIFAIGVKEFKWAK